MGVSITEIQATDVVADSRAVINTNFTNIATDLDGFPDELKNLSTAEIQQLENIGATTISADQWGYLGSTDQALATTDSPTFANITDSSLTASVPVVSNGDKKLVSQTYANFMGSLSGQAGSAFDWNAQDLTNIGSIGVTGTRVTKGWFTDLEITNAPTIGGTSLDSIYAAIDQTMYIGTTAVAINRSSAALTLAGITLTTPDIGTPSAGVLTNCSGTASSLIAGKATVLETARTIAGQSFDGSANITIASTDLSDTTTVGGNLVSLTNPSAETFIKIAADNTVSTRTPENVMADLSGHAGASFSFNDQDVSGVGDLSLASGKNLTYAGAIQIMTGSVTNNYIQKTDGRLVLDLYSNSNDANSSYLRFLKSCGTTGSPTAVGNNDDLGVLSAQGYDGNSYENATQILMECDGTVSDEVVPGRITFKTTDSSGNLDTALVLDSSQNATFSGVIDVASGIKLGSSDNYAIGGDISNSTQVLRRVKLTIDDGTNANTLKCTVSSMWNGDTISETDNIAKDATTGNFTLSSSGGILTIEAAGLAGNVLMADGQIFKNESGTDLTGDVYMSSNDIRIIVRNATSGVGQDLTGLVDTGTISFYILYLTDA